MLAIEADAPPFEFKFWRNVPDVEMTSRIDNDREPIWAIFLIVLTKERVGSASWRFNYFEFTRHWIISYFY